MFDLAQFSKGKPISLSIIAKRQRLPLNYLEQIMLKLKNANLVISVRGAHGGYKLNGNANEITVKDIFDVLEGPISLSECLTQVKCGKSSYCATRLIYKNLSDKFNEITENITLADMVNDKKNVEIKDMIIDL
jgi:Rrf2 family protein